MTRILRRSGTNGPTRVGKHTGGNCLVIGNFLSLQTAICSSTLCINSRGQCTYLHQSKDLMLIVYKSLNQKLKLNFGCSKGSTVGCKQMAFHWQAEKTIIRFNTEMHHSKVKLATANF